MNEITCRDVQLWLDAATELEPPEALKIHVASCQACQVALTLIAIQRRAEIHALEQIIAHIVRSYNTPLN
jgi:hypothetical protein